MSNDNTVSEAEVLKTLERTEKTRNWIGQHFDELRTKYEGKVFAVKDETVIDSSESVETLLENMTKKGEDSALLVIESVPRKGIAYIL